MNLPVLTSGGWGCQQAWLSKQTEERAGLEEDSLFSHLL